MSTYGISTKLIDLAEEESSLDTSFAVIEYYCKQLEFETYTNGKNEVYQEGLKEAWESDTDPIKGREGEHIVVKILKFLPRLFRNIVKWIGRCIASLWAKINGGKKDDEKTEVKVIEETKKEITEMPAEEKKEIVEAVKSGKVDPLFEDPVNGEMPEIALGSNGNDNQYIDIEEMRKNQPKANKTMQSIDPGAKQSMDEIDFNAKQSNPNEVDIDEMLKNQPKANKTMKSIDPSARQSMEDINLNAKQSNPNELDIDEMLKNSKTTSLQMPTLGKPNPTQTKMVAFGMLTGVYRGINIIGPESDSILAGVNSVPGIVKNLKDVIKNATGGGRVDKVIENIHETMRKINVARAVFKKTNDDINKHLTKGRTFRSADVGLVLNKCRAMKKAITSGQRSLIDLIDPMTKYFNVLIDRVTNGIPLTDGRKKPVGDVNGDIKYMCNDLKDIANSLKNTFGIVLNDMNSIFSACQIIHKLHKKINGAKTNKQKNAARVLLDERKRQGYVEEN